MKGIRYTAEFKAHSIKSIVVDIASQYVEL